MKRNRINRKEKQSTEPMIFGKKNYVIMGICVLMIVFGFTIMRLENEIDGFISLYISPVIIMCGFVGVIYAIMMKREPEASIDK